MIIQTTVVWVRGHGHVSMYKAMRDNARKNGTNVMIINWARMDSHMVAVNTMVMNKDNLIDKAFIAAEIKRTNKHAQCLITITYNGELVYWRDCVGYKRGEMGEIVKNEKFFSK